MTTIASQDIRQEWAAYTRGVHFPDPGASAAASTETLTGPQAPAIIRGLALLDLEGEDAAVAAFASDSGGPAELVAWLEIERAALATPPPGEIQDRYEYRAARLAALARAGEGWAARMAEARRLMHLALAKGRTRSPDIKEIAALLDTAREGFDRENDTFGVASCAVILARAHAWRGHLVEAQEALSEAFVGFSVLNNRFRIADTAYELGVALRDLHRFGAARNMLRATLSLREAIGQPLALARVEQALGMTLIAEARYLPDNAALIEEGRKWALRAFARSTRLSGSETPDAEVVRLKAALKRTSIDAFRATVAARDLAEASLLQGDVRSAKGWLNAALMECGLPPAHLAANLPSLRGQFVSPAFEAFSIADQNVAREVAQNSAPFERVRLAELEEMLSPSSDLNAAAYGMSMIARVWRLRASPAYEIEAWLAAASIAEQGGAEAETEHGLTATLFQKTSNAPGEVLPTVSPEAARMAYRSLRVAEAFGSNIHAYFRNVDIVPLRPEERQAVLQAGVQVFQLLCEDGPRRTFRVRAPDAVGHHRLLVWKTDRLSESVLAILPALAGVSRRRNGLAEILRFGADNGVVWVLDELVIGQPLPNVIDACRDAAAACRMLGGLGLTLRALMSAGVPRLRFSPQRIQCLPGDQLVVDQFAPLYDSISDGPFKGAAGKDTVVSDFASLASDWMSRPDIKASCNDIRRKALLDELRRHRLTRRSITPEDQLELMSEALLAFTRLAA